MQKLIRMLSVTALVGGALFSTSALAELKVASINIQAVIQLSPTFKSGMEKLKGEAERKKAELDAEGKRLFDDNERFKKERDLLSLPDRSKREKDIQGRGLDLEQKQRAAQEELNNKQRQVMVDAKAKVDAVIQQITKEKALDLIVVEAYYATPEVDITEEVLKRLGVTLPPPGAAKPAAK